MEAIATHLPNQNLGQFFRQNNAASSSSALLRYFARPHLDSFRNLTYSAYYSQYRHETRDEGAVLREGLEWALTPIAGETFVGSHSKVVVTIKRTRAIVTRLSAVPPRAGELFYLRAILRVKPVYSFLEARTHGNTVYTSYREAAIAAGLFEDANEAQVALREAIEALYRPSQLRFLFAHLLPDLPTNAMELWNEFKEALSQDFVLRERMLQQLAEQHTLKEIESYLRARGCCFHDFGLPKVGILRSQELRVEFDYLEERQAQFQLAATTSIPLLNDEQTGVYLTLLHYTLNPDEAKPIFINGKAGRGKTYVVNALINQLRAYLSIVVVTGTTALSALLYERGRTAHSTFGIPVEPNTTELTSRISPRSGKAELLREATLIVWEEFPMANKAAIECVDVLLKTLMGNGKPFGGKVFVAVGDFRQVAPVVKNATGPTATFDSSIRSSYLWSYFQVLNLIQPVRNAADPEFSNWVDTIGEGDLQEVDFGKTGLLQLIRTVEEAEAFLYPNEIL